MLRIIKNEEIEVGYVDYVTLSSSLLFSPRYVTNYEDLANEIFYNNVRQNNFNADEYLQGVEIVNMDYRALFNQFKDTKNVIFLVDPPYLTTDNTTYESDKYWGVKDYFSVLDVLLNTSYLYFTSNKSQIVELCQWMGSKFPEISINPFKGSTTLCINISLNHNSKYTDMMLYKLK